MDLRDWYRYVNGDHTLPPSSAYNVNLPFYYSAYNRPVKTWGGWEICEYYKYDYYDAGSPKTKLTGTGTVDITHNGTTQTNVNPIGKKVYPKDIITFHTSPNTGVLQLVPFDVTYANIATIEYWIPNSVNSSGAADSTGKVLMKKFSVTLVEGINPTEIVKAFTHASI